MMKYLGHYRYHSAFVPDLCVIGILLFDTVLQLSFPLELFLSFSFPTFMDRPQ